MILVGLYGDSLNFQGSFSAQEWVDSIIKELLFDAPGKRWVSLDSSMPLIAEASPKSFFEAVNNSLSRKDKPIMEMFVEEESRLFPMSHHTGLLWALEGLAWSPEYLYQSSVILSKLSLLDPGGKLANRPINSLKEIFKSWHYQTFASFEERIDILEGILKKEYEIGWTLLISMLPDVHSVAEPTHKMRWRLFDESYDTKYIYEEIWDTHSRVLNLLINYFDFSESRLTELLERSEYLSTIDRSTVLSFIKSNLSKVNQKDYSAWHSLRNILSNHRSHPDAKWALSEKELKNYEKLYELLKPSDPIERVLWMFNEHWPRFPEGIEKKDIPIREQEKLVVERRIKGLQGIYKEFGFEKLKSLVGLVKEPWIYGVALAQIVNKEEEVISLCDFFKEKDHSHQFVQGFIFKKSLTEGLEWIYNIYSKLKDRGFEDNELASLFIFLEQTTAVWNFLEKSSDSIKKEYWSSITPHFYNLPVEDRLFGIEKLIETNRFISAFDICYHDPGEIPSAKLIEVLEKTATRKSDENMCLDSYRAEKIIENLEEREDIDRADMIKLEWLYLPFLASYGSMYKPHLLHEELANDPDFFIEVLKWVYKSEKEEETTEKISDEQMQNRARNAYGLLRSWKRIPGMDQSNKIYTDYLWTWINKVRALATETG
ncbi:MAG TPA: hypothetical protein VFG01_06135, partial [Acidobacteriota bacterium]|nr:hypothetical protein [Acidobacteriota bacterium]